VDFADRAVGESFLQEQLHRSPSILPIVELDESFSPLISLGREIWAIDNLFISPNGRITIVETKLWRNPEATRRVIAQILDYAKRLSSLSYEEFERKCRSAMQPAALSDGTLYQLVSARFPKQVKSEADFIDSVQKNLKNARFMLLIVGDGIHENLEDMLEILHQQPQMLFTFGLVEMQIYQCDGIPGRLVIPQLVARTTEIVRAVVRVENPGHLPVAITLPPDKKDETTTLSEQEFLDSVEDDTAKRIFPDLVAFAKEVGHVQCATASVNARMKFHDTGDLRLFRLYTRGTIGVVRLDRQLQKRGLPDDLAWTLAEKIAALCPGVDVKHDKPDITRRLKASELAGRVDDFISIYRSVIEELKSMTPTVASTSSNDDVEEDEHDV